MLQPLMKNILLNERRPGMNTVLFQEKSLFIAGRQKQTGKGPKLQNIRRHALRWLLPGCLLLIVQGCTALGSSGWVKRQAANGVYPTLSDFHDIALRYDDLTILKTTMEAYLLLTETLVASSPDNTDLTAFLSKMYGYYSFGMVVHEDLERARKLYWKGIQHGKNALMTNPSLKRAVEQGTPLYKALEHLRPEKDLNAAFALALNQGMLLICSLDVPEAVGEANAFKALCQWVIAHDETYFCAGTHSLLGVYYALMPAMMGGGPKKAQEEFDMAIKLYPDFLLHHYLTARYIPTLVDNEPLFDELIQHILEADSGASPDYIAFNEIAKLKARLLEKNRDLYF